MDQYSKKFYDKYEQYFVKTPYDISSLEQYIPFITPLMGYKRFSSHDFSIIVVTTFIQILIYGLNIMYINHIHKKQENGGCECSKSDVTKYIFWYSIAKVVFLSLILTLYTASYNKVLPNYVSQIFPIVVIISAVDIVSLYPLWLFLSDSYYTGLSFSRCECSNSQLKSLPHFFSNISVTSYTVIIISLIHALVSMIFAYIFWKIFLTKK